MNNHLIVEPVDESGRRWVQVQIASLRVDSERALRAGRHAFGDALATGSTSSPHLRHCR
jgi:hypothetical protein